MMRNRAVVPLLAVGVAVLAAACTDAPEPMAPADDAQVALSPGAQQAVSDWFQRSSPVVLALPRTVFADHDESTNRLVFGVETMDIAPRVEAALANLRIPAWAYSIQEVEPIQFMSGHSLRDRHRPTIGGIQIHFSSWLCTLGFSVDHDGGRSMITNSHCTDNQGSTGNTTYYQPTSSVDSSPIAIEAHDPAYFRGGACPRGRVCRYSDSARALYAEGVKSLGRIAKTDAANSGSLEVVGSFDITSQDNSSTSFIVGGTMHKVGRTTGWTSGTVSNTCVDVNVAGSNITQLCQTIVSADQQIVAGGDSGSPVFTGTSDVTLRGILWGGNSSGTLFVFSPFSAIQDELGDMDATTDGEGGPGNGNGNGNGDDESCPPGHQRQGRC